MVRHTYSHWQSYRGNFETPGQLRFAGFEDDILDLHVVVQYLTREYGYVIDLVVGHSRGSVAGMIWLCRYPKEETGTVRGFVNVSGRYRMSVSEVSTCTAPTRLTLV